MAMLVEKDSIRGTARAMGADKDSVALWLKRAESLAGSNRRDLDICKKKRTKI